MAGGTINGSTGNQYIDSKIVWSATADNDTNKSSVTAALYYKRNNTGYTTYGEGTFTISIGGNKTSATKTLTITGDSWVKAVEATEIISHSTDGSKSITISATGSIPSTTLSSTSCSDTVDLDTIPRATTLDSLSCATKYFTGKLTYKYTPQSASYYNRCNISLNLDGTFIAVKSILLGKKTASQKTATVTLSESELAIIYNELPKTNKGVLRFTFRTYSDSDYSKQVGDAKTRDITLYIPNNSTTKPTATMTLSAVNSLSSPFNTLYIKGRSKVDANFTNGKGKYEASIVSYKMNVGGKNYSSPYTSGYLTTTGNITVTGIVTDSRGFSNEYEQSITVIPYSEPKILPASGEKNIICARCDSGGNLSESGTYLKIKAKRSYSKVVSGTQKNFCAIRYRYRDESTNTFSVWKDILKGSETDTDTIDATLSGVVSSAQTSYIVQVGVIDDMGEYDAVQYIIPTDFVTIDIPEAHKGKRIGIGRYAEDSDEPGIDVGMDMYFDEGKTIHGAFADTVAEKGLYTHEQTETVVEGSWRYKKWESGTYDISGIFEVQPTESNVFSGGVGYHSEQIQINLPFPIESIQYTGTPAEQFYWLINAALVNGSEGIIGFRLARFTEINTTSPVNVRLVGHGRWK